MRIKVDGFENTVRKLALVFLWREKIVRDRDTMPPKRKGGAVAAAGGPAQPRAQPPAKRTRGAQRTRAGTAPAGNIPLESVIRVRQPPAARRTRRARTAAPAETATAAGVGENDIEEALSESGEDDEQARTSISGAAPHATPIPPRRRSAANLRQRSSANRELIRLANSTAYPAERDLAGAERTGGPLERLASAIETTLRTVRETSLSEGNSRLVNRLTSAKELPAFSGDPLEWLHFKETYELTSELGGYSDRENVARLFRAIKGDSREAVNTLLATSRDAAAIMRTLELHFGNKRSVARKILADVKALPSIESGKISLTQFATKLKSTVSAFKSLQLAGYLHSPELVQDVGNKLPSALKYAYNQYAAELTENKAELEKLADFLFREAERAIAGGIFDLSPQDAAREETVSVPRLKTRGKPAKAFAGAAQVSASVDVGTNVEERRVHACIVCNRDNHVTAKCSIFAREPVDRRRFLARKFRLCYVCLEPGHIQANCAASNCDYCKSRHHTLLHVPKSKQAVHVGDKGKQGTPRNAAVQQTSGAQIQSNKSA